MSSLHPRRFYDPVNQKTRRYQRITELLKLKSTDTVLNVGCGEGLTFEKFNKVNPITGVDLFKDSKISQENFNYVQIKGDGTLTFKDNEFDVVVSIGVLEHIHPMSALEKTCSEIARVGKKYLILVPHIDTPIEPHYAFPFFQKFSLKTREKIHNLLNNRLEMDDGKENPFEDITYLPTKEWLRLFPGAKAETYWHIGPFITNQIVWKS